MPYRDPGVNLLQWKPLIAGKGAEIKRNALAASIHCLKLIGHHLRKDLRRSICKRGRTLIDDTA